MASLWHGGRTNDRDPEVLTDPNNCIGGFTQHIGRFCQPLNKTAGNHQDFGSREKWTAFGAPDWLGGIKVE